MTGRTESSDPFAWNLTFEHCQIHPESPLCSFYQLSETVELSVSEFGPTDLDGHDAPF